MLSVHHFSHMPEHDVTWLASFVNTRISTDHLASILHILSPLINWYFIDNDLQMIPSPLPQIKVDSGSVISVIISYLFSLFWQQSICDLMFIRKYLFFFIQKYTYKILKHIYDSPCIHITEYETPSGYFTYKKLVCKVEINIIRYEVGINASRGEKECNKYEKLQVDTQLHVIRRS